MTQTIGNQTITFEERELFYQSEPTEQWEIGINKEKRLHEIADLLTSGQATLEKMTLISNPKLGNNLEHHYYIRIDNILVDVSISHIYLSDLGINALFENERKGVDNLPFILRRFDHFSIVTFAMD